MFNEKTLSVAGLGKGGDVVRIMVNFEEGYAECALNGKKLLGKGQWGKLPDSFIPMVKFPGAKGESITIRYVLSA